MTVSEGIGAGIISSGRLVRGGSGMAGEFGHVRLEENGLLCGCGRRGCWEVYASNTAALRAYAEGPPGRSSAGSTGTLAVTFDELMTLAEQGDAGPSARCPGWAIISAGAWR